MNLFADDTIISVEIINKISKMLSDYRVLFVNKYVS